MFCGCRPDSAAEPNTHVCPVCLGCPVLPVPNDEAIRLTVLTGLMLDCEITATPVRPEELLLSGHAEELPDHPIRRAHLRRWALDVELLDGSTKRIGITRVHMEEDVGKTTHGESPPAASTTPSTRSIDYNCAGVPGWIA